MVKEYSVNKSHWTEGIVKEILGSRHYVIYVPKLQQQWKRHVSQMQKHNIIRQKSIPVSSGTSNVVLTDAAMNENIPWQKISPIDETEPNIADTPEIMCIMNGSKEM